MFAAIAEMSKITYIDTNLSKFAKVETKSMKYPKYKWSLIQCAWPNFDLFTRFDLFYHFCFE